MIQDLAELCLEQTYILLESNKAPEYAARLRVAVATIRAENAAAQANLATIAVQGLEVSAADYEDLDRRFTELSEELGKEKRRADVLEDSLEDVNRAVHGGEYDPFCDDLPAMIKKVVDERDDLKKDHAEAAEIATQALHSAAAEEDELKVHKGVIEQQKAEIERLNRELDAMAQRAVMPTFELTPEEKIDEAWKTQVTEPFEKALGGGQPVVEAPRKSLRYDDQPAVVLDPQAQLEAMRGGAVPGKPVTAWPLSIDPDKALVVARLCVAHPLVMTTEISRRLNVGGRIVNDVRELLKGRITALRNATAEAREAELQEIHRGWVKMAGVASGR